VSSPLPLDSPIQNFPITLSYPERVPSPFLQGITGPGSLTGEQIPARAGTPENIRRANERAATLKKAQDAALLTGSGGSRGFLMMAVNAPARPSAQVDEPPAPVPEVVRATASPAPGTPFGAPMPIPINARGPSVPVPQVAPSTSVLSTLPKQPFTALTQDWKKGASASSLLSSLSGEVLKVVGISTYEQLRSYFEVPRPLDSPSLQEISDAIRVGDQRAAAMVPRPTLAGGIVSNPTPRNGGLVIDPDLLGRWRDALLSQNGFHPIPPFISQSHLEPQSLEAKRKGQDEKRIETRIGKVVKRTGGEGSVRYLPEETGEFSILLSRSSIYASLSLSFNCHCIHGCFLILTLLLPHYSLSIPKGSVDFSRQVVPSPASRWSLSAKALEDVSKFSFLSPSFTHSVSKSLSRVSLSSCATQERAKGEVGTGGK